MSNPASQSKLILLGKIVSDPKDEPFGGTARDPQFTAAAITQNYKLDI